MRRFLAARRRGTDWLLERMRPDGALGDPAAGFEYYRAPWTFGLVGEVEAAHAVCGFVRRNLLTSDGRLDGPLRIVQTDWAYRDATFILGAHQIGEYDLSYGLTAELLRWQDPMSGAFANDRLPDGSMSDDMDVPYACGPGFAALAVGRLDAARRVQPASCARSGMRRRWMPLAVSPAGSTRSGRVRASGPSSLPRHADRGAFLTAGWNKGDGLSRSPATGARESAAALQSPAQAWRVCARTFRIPPFANVRPDHRNVFRPDRAGVAFGRHHTFPDGPASRTPGERNQPCFRFVLVFGGVRDGRHRNAEKARERLSIGQQPRFDGPDGDPEAHPRGGVRKEVLQTNWGTLHAVKIAQRKPE